MGLFWQEYWSGLPCLPPGDLPNPGLKRMSPLAPALADRFLPWQHLGSPKMYLYLPPKSHLHSRRHHEPLKSHMAENKSHHIKALKMCLMELKDGPSTLAIDFITLNFIFIP